MSSFSAGVLIVPSDFALAQGVAISSTTGAVVATGLSLGTAEAGAQLADGTIAIGNRGTGDNCKNIKVYDPAALSLLATVALFSESTWDKFSPMASDFATTFYGACKFTSGASSQVKSFTRDGTVGA